MNILELNDIGKSYDGSIQWAVDGFDLAVKKGEIVGLLGESGCGKTTLLRLIAGFEAPSSGTIMIRGMQVAGNGVFIKPGKRHVGIVFQDYALFPHKTVLQNILFGLFRLSREQAERKAREVILLTGLMGLEKRYPHQISGGQKQRVALARALAPEPELILLDEPFSNIDSVMKNQMREELYRIIKETGTTAIFVTHDTKDVLPVADRISILRHGRMVQTDTPQKVYHYPVNTYVADFFGKTNLIKARSTQSGYQTSMGLIHCENPEGFNPVEVTLSIRPESFVITPKCENCFTGEIVGERFLGEFTELTCRTGNSEDGSVDLVIYSSSGKKHPKVCHFMVVSDQINVINAKI